MRWSRFALLLLLAAAAWACRDRPSAPDPRAPTHVPPASGFPAPAEVPGRRAVDPTAETLAAARTALGTTDREPRETTCGPYRALSSAPDEYLEICRSLAGSLDATYEARFGVDLPHPAAGVILVFGSADRFRKFAGEFGRLRAGYAGFAMPSRGVVATLAEDTPLDRFATVLGHELAHLVHRRIFGFNLAPWLSEGLADALGDTAAPTGFAELRGIEGVEPLAIRLQQAIEAGRADSVGAVITKTRASFDRAVVSYDYETSALLVRFLLLDADLGPRFREALTRLASPERCDPSCLVETLQVSETDLDRRFRRWLVEMTAATDTARGS